MFDSSVLDVGIGLVFVFLLLSLVASAAKEGLEAIFKRRAKDLEKGFKELIGNDGTKFINKLYDHGLINSLFSGTYGDKNAELPSYIPSKNFALAVMDLRNKSLLSSTPPIVLPDKIKQAFEAFQITAGQDVDKLQKQVEDWYNASMDRVSGWYKRRSQWWIAGLGLVLTIAVNVDCVVIAKRLSTDKTLRQAVVQVAQRETKNNEGANNQGPNVPAAYKTATSDPTIEQTIGKIKTNLSALDGVGLPIGWQADIDQWHKERQTADGKKPEDLISNADRHLAENVAFHIPGWLITALAVSLGAPFWFDVLNKIMVVRSTVKPHEKSREESSKDPTKKPDKPVTTAATGT